MKSLFSKKSIFGSLLTLLLLSVSFTTQAFTNLQGKPDTISNYIGKGKWTIVEVWESSCHVCRQHMPDMVKLDGKLSNARILGVSLDTQDGIENAEDFIAEFNIKFPTLISNFVEMNVWMQKSLDEPLMGTPTFILFDDKGALVAAQAGAVSTTSLEKFIKMNSGKSEMQVVDVQKDTNKTNATDKNTDKLIGLPAETSEE